MHIALLYNLKPAHAAPDDDTWAEFDTPKTLDALTGAMRGIGHTVDLIPFDASLVPKFAKLPGDLIFSIAENLGGVAREAWVPALCDIHERPYAFSGVLANALTLDKAMTKRVLIAEGVPVTSGQVIGSLDEGLNPYLAERFPLFVKPLHEGSGKGIYKENLVRDEVQLRAQLERLIGTYGQPVLVEPYLTGREFTVGVVGNDPVDVMIMEIDFSALPEDHRFYSHYWKDDEPEAPKFTSPPDLPSERIAELQEIALRIKALFRLHDCFRFDVRCDAEGHPNVLEINPLPGLTPNYSDLPRMLSGYGLRYEDLIGKVLTAAQKRWNLL